MNLLRLMRYERVFVLEADVRIIDGGGIKTVPVSVEVGSEADFILPGKNYDPWKTSEDAVKRAKTDSLAQENPTVVLFEFRGDEMVWDRDVDDGMKAFYTDSVERRVAESLSLPKDAWVMRRACIRSYARFEDGSGVRGKDGAVRKR